jgi:hypothetical protein
MRRRFRVSSPPVLNLCLDVVNIGRRIINGVGLSCCFTGDNLAVTGGPNPGPRQYVWLAASLAIFSISPSHPRLPAPLRLPLAGLCCPGVTAWPLRLAHRPDGGLWRSAASRRWCLPVERRAQGIRASRAGRASCVGGGVGELHTGGTHEVRGRRSARCLG